MALKRTKTARTSPNKPKRKKAAPKSKKDKTPKEGQYMGIPYESFCELSCIYFAEELMKGGYVTKIERSPTYLLCDSVSSTYSEQLKRGSKTVTQTIARGVSYTPDFDIYFTEKAIGKFCWVLGTNSKWTPNLLVAQTTPIQGVFKATIEVKPDFSRNSTTPKSVQAMRWLYQRNNVFTNLFRPNRIFEGLFVPDKYRLTERGTPRLLKFKPKALQDYLKTLK
jgi:hypothetical protein